MKTDHNKMFNDIVSGLKIRPRLILHTCCAPCSSSVLEKLEKFFDISIYYFNPNIAPEEEYDRRLAELRFFLRSTGREKNIKLIEPEYNHLHFLTRVSGLEEEKEGGKRCYECYKMRLEETMRHGIAAGFDYFTTALSVSPYKNAEWINHLGIELAKRGRAQYLPADFKKNNGYLRSLELSRQHGLYRQDYCGCEFSIRK